MKITYFVQQPKEFLGLDSSLSLYIYMLIFYIVCFLCIFIKETSDFIHSIKGKNVHKFQTILQEGKIYMIDREFCVVK